MARVIYGRVSSTEANGGTQVLINSDDRLRLSILIVQCDCKRRGRLTHLPGTWVPARAAVRNQATAVWPGEAQALLGMLEPPPACEKASEPACEYRHVHGSHHRCIDVLVRYRRPQSPPAGEVKLAACFGFERLEFLGEPPGLGLGLVGACLSRLHQLLKCPVLPEPLPHSVYFLLVVPF